MSKVLHDENNNNLLIIMTNMTAKIVLNKIKNDFENNDLILKTKNCLKNMK